jgi:hypothetical protein
MWKHNAGNTGQTRELKNGSSHTPKNKNKAPTFSLSVCVSENFIAFSLNPRVSEMIFLEFGRGKWETENARKEKGKVVRREMASGYGE